MKSVVILSARRSSTLADKLRAAASVNGELTRKAAAKTTVTQEGDGFNELYVMPKRKLRGQLQIEQATGRRQIIERSRIDLPDRMAVRKDRSTDMATDQDWPSVWPAARTFNASAVPLPVRMGTRPDVEKRAPFKKHGNLELVKIPNFLHLTPAAIERHCNALKQFCTPFPKALDDDKRRSELFPVTIEYNDYVHQGTNIRDTRARVVTMRFKLAHLELPPDQKAKMIRLVGKKYDEASDTVTFIVDRCHTRKQNYDYANYLLTVLYHEAQKVEAWEKEHIRQDSLKVEFEGSTCREGLLRILQSDGEPLDEEKSEKLKKFGDKLWKEYRNTEETPEATRLYAQQMKELLGIKTPQQQQTAN